MYHISRPLVACSIIVLAAGSSRSTIVGQEPRPPEPATLAELIESLGDADHTRARLAFHRVEQLGALASPAVDALILRLKDSRPIEDGEYPGTYSGCAVEALRAVGPAAIEPLLACIADPQNPADQRAQAIYAITYMDVPAARTIQLLIRSLGDPSEEVRVNAASAMSIIGPKRQEVVDAMIDALRDPAPRVQSDAIQVLMANMPCPMLESTTYSPNRSYMTP